MRRREFLVGAGATAAAAFGVRAQSTDQLRRVGIIVPGSANDARYQSWIQTCPTLDASVACKSRPRAPAGCMSSSTAAIVCRYTSAPGRVRLYTLHRSKGTLSDGCCRLDCTLPARCGGSRAAESLGRASPRTYCPLGKLIQVLHGPDLQDAVPAFSRTQPRRGHSRRDAS